MIVAELKDVLASCNPSHEVAGWWVKDGVVLSVAKAEPGIEPFDEFLVLYLREREEGEVLPEPSPKGTDSPAVAAAEDQGYSWSPAEEVPWSRIMEAVPDEAAALKTVLVRGGLDLDRFCCWRDGDCELYDEDDDLPDDQDPPIEEFLEVAWDHLARHFERQTGLRLYTFCRHHREFGDPETGFKVVGGWERSPAGKRFFGL
jgi:hypothetical protein